MLPGRYPGLSSHAPLGLTSHPVRPGLFPICEPHPTADAVVYRLPVLRTFPIHSTSPPVRTRTATWVARKELLEQSLVTLPVGRRRLRRNRGIVHWMGRRLTLAEETFIGLCRSATEGWEDQPSSAG